FFSAHFYAPFRHFLLPDYEQKVSTLYRGLESYMILTIRSTKPNQMKKSQKNQNEQENKQHFVGWMLFVLCAVFFIASSIKNRDVLTLIGSIFFLVSCVFFIIPLVKKMKPPNQLGETENNDFVRK
ncbi:DUF3784 domain-containing protein, partial [Desulfocicer vacuolatum]|uniref:DUF3784 domain-containing protein n=1 Tax=Desulfocicer vacuolatum TaxID=2298 RepID=UPI0009FDCEE3